MAYKWERCPRCGSAKVRTKSAWRNSCRFLFFGILVCILILDSTADHIMQYLIIILGIIILIMSSMLVLFVKGMMNGAISHCKDCNYSWTPKKIED